MPGYEFEELGELEPGDVLELPIPGTSMPGGTGFRVDGPSEVFACEVAITRLADGERFHYPQTWRVCKVIS